MDLTPETDEYIRESIEDSVGLPVTARTLRLKLIASEDERHRLQDQIFLLGDRLDDAERRLDECRVETSMNALELRKCIEEKAAMISEHQALTEHCAALEEECSLYERNLKRLMEVCDDLGKENDALQARLLDNSVVRLVDEIGSLKQDKQQLRINLCRAEDEVKALFEENKLLDQVNQRLLRQLKKERQDQETNGKHSNGSSVENLKLVKLAAYRNVQVSSCSPAQSLKVVKLDEYGIASLLYRDNIRMGRPKSTLKEGNPEDPQNAGPPRQPLSPLQHN